MSANNRDCKIVQGVFDRWIIVYAHNPAYGWAGIHWERHKDGLPMSRFQICNFDSAQAAEEYATGAGLNIVRELGAAREGGAA